MLLGYLSDWSHLLVTMPAEQLAVRMQTTGASAPAAFRQIRAEGGGSLQGFYKGIAAYLILALKPAIQNAVFESLRRRLLERAARAAQAARRGAAARRPSELSAAHAFALGALARAVATLLVFPCIRAKVLLMTRAAASAGSPAASPAGGGGARADGGGEAAADGPPPGLRDVLLRVVREEGVLALYQGVRPELVKGVLSASLMLAAKEKIGAANRALLAAAFSAPRGAEQGAA